MKNLKKIAITTGDRNGIGFEILTKALLEKKISKIGLKSVFFIFRHQSQKITQPYLFKLIDKKYTRVVFNNFLEAYSFVEANKSSLPPNVLIDLALNTSEAEWVRQASIACINKKLTSLVTGPLSKKISVDLSNKPMGHTGIFRELFPKKNLFMSFVGSHFNIILATDHIPLSEVEKSLKKTGLGPVIKAANILKDLLSLKKPIAILGLNPHSGENGLIGNTEKILFSNLSKKYSEPLVPDAAFLKKNLKKYSLFVCLYHDQGLIPFKMLHGQDSGVHLTIGLPFIRTSVDHGTAYELFNKNIANPSSMIEAINLNIKLIGA